MFANAYSSTPSLNRNRSGLHLADDTLFDFKNHYMVSQDGYEVRVLDNANPLRTRAHDLVARLYLERGLIPPRQSEVERQGDRTVVALAGAQVIGALTVGVDDDRNLLADTLYKAQIDVMRDEGARLCELTRLAMEPTIESGNLLTTIFTLGFIVGRFMLGATDALIEVNPRHASYYSRRFGYRIAGPERICPRVSAPAVLMHASLTEAEAQIHQDGGKRYRCSPSLRAMLLERANARALLTAL